MHTTKEKKSFTSIVWSTLTTLITRKEFILLLRLFIGALFIYAAHDKILRPDQFAVSVRAYRIIPIELSNIFALGIAWSEMIAGILLFLGLLTRPAASIIFVLLLVFIGAIATSLIRGLVIDCGCFKAGEGGHIIDSGLLFRDVLLLAATYLIVIYDRGFFGLGKLFSQKQT